MDWWLDSTRATFYNHSVESSTLKKLMLGSGLRMAALFVTIAIGLVLQPYVIHTLGNELFGVWDLATSFVAMFSLLDIGLNAAVSRYVATTIGAKDYAGLNRYFNTGFYLFTGASCLALFFAGVAALYLFHFPNVMPDGAEQHASATAVVIIIMGAQFAVMLPLQAINGLLIGSLRYDIITSIDIIFKIINATAVFLTLFFGGGIIALAIASFVCVMISKAVTYWFARRQVPQAEIAVRHFDKKTIKELFSYSAYAFIAQISETFRFTIPKFIIGGFISATAVTHYFIAATLCSYFVMVISAFLGVLMPVFARHQANNDFQAIRKTLRFSIKISTTIAVFVGFGMIAWGHPFIKCWMVEEEFLVAYPWLVILVAGYLTALCQSPAIGMLYGLAKHSFHAIVNTTEAILNLILGLILIQFYGCLGIAIAAMIPIVLVKLTIQPWFVCHVIQESLLLYYWNIIRTALTCAVALILPSIVTYYLAAPNYPALLLTGALSAALYLPVVFIVFTKAEREYVWNAIRKKR